MEMGESRVYLSLVGGAPRVLLAASDGVAELGEHDLVLLKRLPHICDALPSRALISTDILQRTALAKI